MQRIASRTARVREHHIKRYETPDMCHIFSVFHLEWRNSSQSTIFGADDDEGLEVLMVYQRR